jgi:exopolysaccharide biosynthesis polyprenyl glycosylphosphotransferase
MNTNGFTATTAPAPVTSSVAYSAGIATHALTAETALPDASLLAPPLRVVAPLPLSQPVWRERKRTRSSRLTWLFDGAGWPWLRAASDLTSVMSAIAITAAIDPRDITDLLPLPPLVMVLFWLRGMYRRRISPLLLQGTMSVASGLAIATITLAIGNAYATGHPLPELAALHVWILSVLIVGVARAALLGIRHLLRVLGIVTTPTLILGAGVVGDRVAERLSARRGSGLDPIGFLDSDSSSEFALGRVSDLPVLGAPEDLEDVVRWSGATHVLISFARERDHDLVPLIRRCAAIGVDVSLVPRLFESINDRLTRESLGPMPLYVMQATNPRSWEFALKHVIDRTVALAALVALAPALAAVALAVRLSSPGPALFRQRRIGRDGQQFELLKFRSMRLASEESWQGPDVGLAPGGIEGEDRRTAVGRFLRRTSIDELPQLWNVLRGEMSLVGPRPERPEYVARFGDELERYDDRHRVKSGITGWAQVNGLRGKSDLENRIQWDNYYIENWTLALDLKILARTVIAVFQPAE